MGLGLVIHGPAADEVDTAYPLVATLYCLTATLPTTYVWQATRQSPVTQASGPTDTVGLTWSRAGSQAITVKAISADTPFTDVYAIGMWERHFFCLPLFLRQSW